MLAHLKKWHGALSFPLLLVAFCCIADAARPTQPEHPDAMDFVPEGGTLEQDIRGEVVPEHHVLVGDGPVNLTPPIGDETPEHLYRNTSTKSLRTKDLYKKGLKQQRTNLQLQADHMSASLKKTSEAADFTHTTMDRYDEHVHKVDDQLESLDGMLDKLSAYKVQQFSDYEPERTQFLDKINPARMEDIHELEAEDRDHLHLQAQMFQAQDDHDQAVEHFEHQHDHHDAPHDHMALLTEQVERAGQFGDPEHLRLAWEALKSINNASGAPQLDGGHLHEEVHDDVHEEEGEGAHVQHRVATSVPIPEDNSEQDEQLAAGAGLAESVPIPQDSEEGADEQLAARRPESKPIPSDSEDAADEQLAANDGKPQEEDAASAEDSLLEISAGTNEPVPTGGLNNLDPVNLLEQHIELQDESASEAAWKALPSKNSAIHSRMPQFFAAIRGEADTTEFANAMIASDQLDNTGKDLAVNAAKTTESLVNTHKKVDEWHSAVKDNIRDLDKFQRNVNDLGKHMFRDLKEQDVSRLEHLEKWKLEHPFAKPVENERDLGDASSMPGFGDALDEASGGGDNHADIDDVSFNSNTGGNFNDALSDRGSNRGSNFNDALSDNGDTNSLALRKAENNSSPDA